MFKRHFINTHTLSTIFALLFAGTAFAQPAPGWGPGYGMGSGMIGGGMMGGGMGNYPVSPGWGGKVLSFDDAQNYIQYGNTHGTADVKANSVTFTGNDVVINLVAVQPGYKDQTFELHGLTNPTIIVPRGATVQLNQLNMDYGNNMEHTVVITTVPPPYPYMAMMYLGQPQVPPMPELPWRSSDDLKTAQYAALGESFVASAPGEYWYVCPAPEHAEEGMYGKFIVQ
ncbi:hypothetical protein AA11237_1259 [Acidocella aminolytica 101 = DSM 11237]|jgi:rusticyanin|nr:hypothetical protein AA11237_1259 [Acidocella aminolytica 101 = DSM 11237]